MIKEKFDHLSEEDKKFAFEMDMRKNNYSNECWHKWLEIWPASIRFNIEPTDEMIIKAITNGASNHILVEIPEHIEFMDLDDPYKEEMERLVKRRQIEHEMYIKQLQRTARDEELWKKVRSYDYEL